MKKLLVSLAILLWLPLQLMAKEYITYHHNDYLGTPVVETNEAGQVIKIDEYSAYGIKDYDQPKEFGSASKIGYTGHQYDAALDLNYMQARYYDPDLGRFLALDPVMFVEDNPLSFNRYAYANDNPYRYVDPDGRYAFVITRGPSIVEAIAVTATGTAAIANMDASVSAKLNLGMLKLISNHPLYGMSVEVDPEEVPEEVPTEDWGNIDWGDVVWGGDGIDGPTTLIDPVPEASSENPGQVNNPQKKKKSKKYNTGSGEHVKGKRKSTEGKHQKGDARRKRDQGEEKGDDRRPY